MVGKFFQLEQKQTSVRIELTAGLTTFLTMAYIIFVNPIILSSATGMDKEALIAVTCIVTAAATVMTGILANAPIAMAPGMGLNAFFAYLVASEKMDWQTALGVVFLSGLLFLLLTVLGLRKRMVEAIPPSLISAIAVGIGLFITFIGLVKLGVVVADEHTLVTAGPITTTVLMGLFGLLVMIFFEMKKISGGLVVGILAATALAVMFDEKTVMPQDFVSVHLNIQAISFKLNILGALKWSFLGTIFTLTFMDMFDSVGTLVACCHQAKMIDQQGRITGLNRLMGIDALATVFGALLGTSTTTAYVESAAGIEQGGRSGLTSIVTGILFLLALLFVPIVQIVPGYATAPALIMVGLFMMKEVRRIDFANLEQAFPAFIIVVMIALSYSISTGLAFGFISFTLIKLVSGKMKDIKPAMWVIAVLSILFLTLDRLPALIQYLRQLFNFQ
ncbi:MAG: NCS2 family permease [Planctomycetota bacterium]|jgi:AGZA family xanthine/uracil permease-like MFS transporter